MVARGEGEGKVIQRVALVVVLDGVREVYRISGIGLQRVHQVDDDALAAGLDFGLLHLRGRNHHLLAGVLQLDVFVKLYAHPVVVIAQGTRLGRTAQEHRGIYVNRAALYTSHAGTRIESGSHRDGSSPTAKEMSYPRSHSVFSVNALQKYTLSPNKAHCFRYFNRNHASADGEYRKHGRGIHGARAENTRSTDGEYTEHGRRIQPGRPIRTNIKWNNFPERQSKTSNKEPFHFQNIVKKDRDTYFI